MTLNLDLEDGEVTGLIEYSRNPRNGEDVKDISLNGNFFWRSAKLRMSIVKQGEVFDCGLLKVNSLEDRP